MTSKKKKAKPRKAPRRSASGKSEPTPTVDAERRSPSPVVVVGASAGGLDAFKRLLGAMPRAPGFATVLVPHLDPRHESLMSELLAKHSPLPVQEARDGETIKADRVYVIPPNRYLAIHNDKLELSEPPARRPGQTAIDFALCSAARDQKEAAIGIVLSGTGHHGVLGIKEIKLAGGLVLVQDPDTAEFDQMPRSALGTGVVDQVLAPEAMPQALARYVRDWPSSADGKETHTTASDGLHRVLAILQSRRKHDFHRYRKNMIARRLRRRMTLLQIPDLSRYTDYLREHDSEIDALLCDLLIGVTAFFRDAEAFKALAEHVLPELVEKATAEEPVRVWIPGCATGEEAYSIAMLLIEQFQASEKTPSLQMFATDIDENALSTARLGIYPDTIASAVSAERLKQFFVKADAHHYQVSKQLRDSVVFASQNLISDAPFSRLDLISCRNLLIYLEPDIQEQVISLLHFALKEGGFLLLGPSESIGRTAGMFDPIVKKWRLFRRTGPVRRDLVSIPISAHDANPLRDGVPRAAKPATSGFAPLLRRLLLDDFTPAAALINRNLEILSTQGPLENYLAFPQGDMTKDLLALARQGLRTRVHSVCQAALQTGSTTVDGDARVRRNDHYEPCRVTARPVKEPDQADELLLVVFEDRPRDQINKGAETAETAPAEATLIDQLESELRATREDLQTTIEELETSNEELKASNEEVMSMNEELQSTNEELETSKEELQSLNEELATVNSQLHDKVEDLDSSYSDLTNLMSATKIATIFLDTALRIKRFTPTTERLLNLLTTDIGRPLRDFAPRFIDKDLLTDAERVLESLVPREKEICAEDERWYLRRILPYRTRDDRIAGVVITFIDITARISAEAQVRRLASVLRDSNDAIIVTTPDGQITAWNHGAELAYGYGESDALKMNFREIIAEAKRDSVREIARRAIGGETIEPFETQRMTRDGRLLDVWVTLTALKNGAGETIAIARTERDVTARLGAEVEIKRLNAELEQRVLDRTRDLAASERQIRAILDAAVDAIITIDKDGLIRTFNTAAERMFGYESAEVIGKNIAMLMGPPYRKNHDNYLRRYLRTGKPAVINRVREFRAQRKDGSDFPIQLSVSEVTETGLFTGIVRDMTEQRLLQEHLVGAATTEQRRLGEELHDTTLQEVTGLGLLAQELLDSLGPEQDDRQRDLAAKLATGISGVNRQIRRLANGLVPVPVDAEGLMTALANLARRVDEENSGSCTFVCPEPVQIESDTYAMHLYRIAQEAVANALKHSNAEAITILLTRRNGAIQLEIRDNGIGISLDEAQTDALGLRIMEHRCGLMGGTFSARRRESGGTVISCELPYQIGTQGHE